MQTLSNNQAEQEVADMLVAAIQTGTIVLTEVADRAAGRYFTSDAMDIRRTSAAGESDTVTISFAGTKVVRMRGSAATKILRTCREQIRRRANAKHAADVSALADHLRSLG